MSIIQKIKDRQTNRGLDCIHIDDWDIDVYFKPMSPFELDEMKRQIPDLNSDNPRTTSLAKIVAKRALDVDGVRLFNDEDYIILSKEPINIITSITNAMSGDTKESAEKN